MALLALALLFIVPPAGAQTTVDYDTDDNRLIEIDTPAKLNAIRHDLDGDGLRGSVSASVWNANYDTSGAFPNPDSSQCPTSCQGYELTADLDLSGYSNWDPIGSFANQYATAFNGNGHTISGLTVNLSANRNAGLFDTIGGAGARISYVGIIAPNIRSSDLSGGIGGLVGRVDEDGFIDASYVLDAVLTMAAGSQVTGGLAGRMDGDIRASYATAAIGLEPCGTCNGTNSGGLAGRMDGGIITASYAAATSTVTTGGGVTQFWVGGLVGNAISVGGANDTNIIDSYCQAHSSFGGCLAQQSGLSLAPPLLAARQLKRPTAYATIYENWNVDLDGDPMTNDDPWDFGGPRDYPLLKADRDGDGTATWQEFGQQYRAAPPGPLAYNWRADHPEIYASARHNITAACAVRTTSAGDDAVTTSTLTFNLAEYTRPVTLALSLWDGTHFRSLQSQGIAMPALQRDGQTAMVEVVTDPARTRFRLDGPYGLNLVLGYADCHTDDS